MAERVKEGRVVVVVGRHRRVGVEASGPLGEGLADEIKNYVVILAKGKESLEVEERGAIAKGWVLARYGDFEVMGFCPLDAVMEEIRKGEKVDRPIVGYAQFVNTRKAIEKVMAGQRVAQWVRLPMMQDEAR